MAQQQSGRGNCECGWQVTAVGDGETMILAVTPEGRADACYVAVGAAAWRFRSEDELAETLTLTGQLPYSDGK